ncbi:MAG: guanylate kinase [Clostridiales bacterium]|nr:guanylate kinase [Clostridiales bacterium]MDE6617541.1 guanylate kinase [Clostridiales bacterium]
MNKGLLIVISGPSGAGKGTIYSQIIKRTDMKRSVSVTTRQPRPGEVEGVNYYFRTEEQYQQMIAAGDFLETAEVYHNLYGTPKAPVFENMKNGYNVLFEVDVHGVRSIKKKYPEAVAIFIMTPDFKTLEQRLRARGTETEDSLKIRLGAARRELSEYKLFDYIVFNDEVDLAIDEVLDIITAEKRKIINNEEKIQALLAEQDEE